MPSDSTWWRDAVIYQIYPKSWADADGDGIGDVAGIRSRLAHLTRLGVDAVWFSPWYRSPQADGGYDVTDYRDIDPMFGTVAEVEALVAEAHELGLKVIVDVVPNHTSNEHPFFVEALASEPGSAAWARYHCVRGKADGAEPPNDWGSVFGGPAWSQILNDEGSPTGYWYLHLFDAAQPDLNWEHPEVHEEFLETLRFWFDRGIDGFRIDVAHGLAKPAGYPDAEMAEGERPELLGAAESDPQWDNEAVHEIWREWRQLANTYSPPRAFVGEVWVATAAAHAAYLRPDELHTAFNFHYLKCPWDATELRAVVDRSIHEAGLVGAPTTWVLENHDVARVRTRYAKEAASDALGLTRARAALVFMLGLPGSAYIYQGQELGLPEVLDLPDEVRQDPGFHRKVPGEGYRDGCRVPFPWDQDGPSFGFSDNGASWLPVPADWADLSVVAQTDAPDSVLELTRRTLALRKAHVTETQTTWVSAPESQCLVLGRQSTESELLVAMNLGDQPALVRASEVLLTSGPEPVAVANGFLLAADSSAWLR